LPTSTPAKESSNRKFRRWIRQSSFAASSPAASVSPKITTSSSSPTPSSTAWTGHGSPRTLPCSPWAGPRKWNRTIFEYDGLRYIGAFAPLFVHQYSQAWFDFRGKRDQFADYFQNSIIATDAHRIFCLEERSQFPDYADDLWGITASDSKNGYIVWGGPPAMGPIDGTVVPCAAGGSIPFLPANTMRVLHNIHDHYPNAWCRYGFIDAFNPLTGWYDTDVIGIDTGITMVMAENARSGYVWEMFMKNPEAQRGMQIAGFNTYAPVPPLPGAPQKTVPPAPATKP
jgi:hypothetical protein